MPIGALVKKAKVPVLVTVPVKVTGAMRPCVPGGFCRQVTYVT